MAQAVLHVEPIEFIAMVVRKVSFRWCWHQRVGGVGRWLDRSRERHGMGSSSSGWITTTCTSPNRSSESWGAAAARTASAPVRGGLALTPAARRESFARVIRERYCSLNVATYWWGRIARHDRQCLRGAPRCGRTCRRGSRRSWACWAAWQARGCSVGAAWPTCDPTAMLQAFVRDAIHLATHGCPSSVVVA